MDTKENNIKKDTIKIKKDNNKKNKNGLLISITSLFIGALIMYLLLYYVIPFDNSQTVINKSEKEVTVTDKGIADAVEKLYDAVVVVEVYKKGQLTSTGTGFVYKKVDKTAYILTNNHVVADGDSVKVKFTNFEEADVTVLGKDEFSDLAVLSINSKEILEVASIGDNSSSRLGDTVFTIGAPLDTEYYWTVTRGVLSGKDRMVEVSLSNNSTSDYVMKVLQTDASINSGNSGGPLANANGEVIGITNMKLVSNGVEGIGFAIPIEDAVQYAESIINGESVSRPLLGVKMLDLSNRYALYQQGITLNTELTSGVVVVEVQTGSPAANAGLKRGDIIIKVDENNVTGVPTLRYYLYKHSVGDTMSVIYERNGKNATAKVKLNVAGE